jgi:hypothetical protein
MPTLLTSCSYTVGPLPSRWLYKRIGEPRGGIPTRRPEAFRLKVSHALQTRSEPSLGFNRPHSSRVLLRCCYAAE